MPAFRIVATAVIVVMSALGLNIAIHDSFDHGVGLDTFLSGSSSPWQLFINQDLVTGLWLAVTWLIFRQRGARVLDTVAWVWMAMWWGNIVVAAYVLLAAHQARGDLPRFFMGARAGTLRRTWSPGAPLRILLVAAAVAVVLFTILQIAQARSGIAAAGWFLGFAPIALSLALLGFPSTVGRRATG